VTTAWIAAFAALWTISLVTAFLVLGLMRRISNVLEGVEQRLRGQPTHGGLPIGSTVPKFEASSEGGRIMSSQELMIRANVYLFLSAGCSPCERLAKELQDASDSTARWPLIVVYDTPESAEVARLSDGTRTLHDGSRSVFRAFEIDATPFAVAVDRAGTVIGNAVPNSIDALNDLVETLGREVNDVNEVSGEIGSQHALH
jgi:hypothetical protein